MAFVWSSSDKVAVLIDLIVLEDYGSQNRDTFLYLFRCVRPDEQWSAGFPLLINSVRRRARRVLAAKLNVDFLNQTSCITEMSETWVAHNFTGVDRKKNRQNRRDVELAGRPVERPVDSGYSLLD